MAGNVGGKQYFHAASVKAIELEQLEILEHNYDDETLFRTQSILDQ
jgi:hypothetical protein